MCVGGVIPGSEEERRAVKLVTGTLRNIVDYIELVDVPVYTWWCSCSVRYGGVEKPCVLLPYSPPLKANIRPRDLVAVRAERVREVDLEGKVAVINYPERPEELRLLTYIVSRRNPAAILMATSQNDLLKSDLVLGSPGFTYAPSVPPSVPVICVDRPTLHAVVSSGLEVEAESRVSRSSAKVVVAGLNGRGELEVHLTSHHDSIIGGFETTPTSILLSVLEHLKRLDLPVNLTIISYTAREIGDADFTEYHYTWGERYLLRILSSKGRLERVLYNVSIGPLCGGGVRVKVAAHPALGKHLESGGVQVDYNHFLLESHPYMELGVPAVTITTRESQSCRNSTCSAKVPAEIAGGVQNILRLILGNVEVSEDLVRITRSYLLSAVEERSLELRVEVAKLTNIVQPSNVSRVVKTISRLAHSLVYLACTHPFRVYANASLLASVSHHALGVLRELLLSCKDEIILGDSKTFTFMKPAPNYADFYLANYVMHSAKVLKSLVSSELGKLLCEHYLERCVESGKKSHRNR